MEIIDKGFILGQKKFGENGTIINVFSKKNGIIRGLKKYSPKKNKGLIFDLISFSWKSRLVSGLGYLNFEIYKSYYSLDESFTLNLLKASAAELCLKLIPLREINTEIFNDLAELIEITSNRKNKLNKIIKFYILWEIQFLQNLGYGFDFSKCAVSGKKNHLKYISPRTRRVVSESVGKPWEKKLLVLPDFLIFKKQTICKSDLLKGLNLTYYFLNDVLKKTNTHEKSTFIFRKRLLDHIIRFSQL